MQTTTELGFIDGDYVALEQTIRACNEACDRASVATGMEAAARVRMLISRDRPRKEIVRATRLALEFLCDANRCDLAEALATTFRVRVEVAFPPEQRHLSDYAELRAIGAIETARVQFRQKLAAQALGSADSGRYFATELAHDHYEQTLDEAVREPGLTTVKNLMTSVLAIEFPSAAAFFTGNPQLEKFLENDRIDHVFLLLGQRGTPPPYRSAYALATQAFHAICRLQRSEDAERLARLLSLIPLLRPAGARWNATARKVDASLARWRGDDEVESAHREGLGKDLGDVWLPRHLEDYGKAA